MTSHSETYSVRLAVMEGDKVKAELQNVGRTGEKSFERIGASAQRTSHHLRHFGGLVHQTQESLSRLQGVLGTLTAAGGLSLLTSRALLDADQIVKLSNALGVSSEALQEYGYAAKCAEIDQNVFEMALARFTRRMGEAAHGGGTATEALETLGITLKTQVGTLKKSEDLLMEVASAFERVADPAERVRLSFKLFGAGGVPMLSLLGSGADALHRLRQEAKDLGLVLETDLLKNAAKTQRHLETLGQVVRTHLNRALLESAPLLGDMAQGLSKVAAAAGNAYQRVKSFFSDETLFKGKSLSEMEQLIQTLQKRLETKEKAGVFEPWDMFGAPDLDLVRLEKAKHALSQKKEEEALKALGAAHPLEMRARPLSPPSLEYRSSPDQKVLASLRQEIAGLHLSAKERFIQTAQDRLSHTATKEQREEVKHLAAALYEEKAALEAVTQAQKERDALVRQGQHWRLAYQEPLQKYQDALQKIQDLLKAGAIDQKTAASAQKEAYEELLQTSDHWSAGVLRGLRQVQEESGSWARHFEHLTTQAFARSEEAFLKWAKTGKFAASDLFETIGDEMLRMAYRTAIVQPLSGALGSVIGSLGSGLKGLFGMAHQGGVLGEDVFSCRKAPPTLFENSPRYHQGGLVGEVPLLAQRGEAIFTKGQLKALGQTLQSKPFEIQIHVENKVPHLKVGAYARQEGGTSLRLDLVLEQVEAALARHVQEGQGLAPTLERRYGLSPAAGIYR